MAVIAIIKETFKMPFLLKPVCIWIVIMFYLIYDNQV